VPDNRSTYPVCGPVDHFVQIGADIDNDGHGRTRQINPYVAELVDTPAWPVLVAQADDDAFDAMAVARQAEPQTASGVVRQHRRDREARALNVDVHATPL
jgi:hypothetical protein